MYSEEVRKLLNKLCLEVDETDYVSTRNAVLSLIVSLHPDKTGGDFADEHQKESFEHALKLRDLFDQEISAATQLIPIQQVSNLIETIAKLQNLPPAAEQSPQLKAQEQFRQKLIGV